MIFESIFENSRTEKRARSPLNAVWAMCLSADVPSCIVPALCGLSELRLGAGLCRGRAPAGPGNPCNYTQLAALTWVCTRRSVLIVQETTSYNMFKEKGNVKWFLSPDRRILPPGQGARSKWCFLNPRLEVTGSPKLLHWFGPGFSGGPCFRRRNAAVPPRGLRRAAAPGPASRPGLSRSPPVPAVARPGGAPWRVAAVPAPPQPLPPSLAPGLLLPQSRLVDTDCLPSRRTLSTPETWGKLLVFSWLNKQH